MAKLSRIWLLSMLCVGPVWGEIVVTDPYLALLAPEQQQVACMVLENQGDSVVRLLGARTAEGQAVQLGEGRWDDKPGRYRFRPLTRLVVPAGGQALLQPQGFWLWFADAQIRPAGEQALVLQFDDGSEVPVSLPLREVPAPAPQS